MMRIIEIQGLPNGSHRNQLWSDKNIPDGYAVIPDGMDMPSFPFGEITAEEIDGVMTVTDWMAGREPEPFPDFEEVTETGVSAVEQLRADVDFIAIMTGVDLQYGRKKDRL